MECAQYSVVHLFSQLRLHLKLAPTIFSNACSSVCNLYNAGNYLLANPNWDLWWVLHAKDCYCVQFFLGQTTLYRLLDLYSVSVHYLYEYMQCSRTLFIVLFLICVLYDLIMQQASVQQAVFEEQEKRYLRKVLVEERTRYCTLATCFRPVVVSLGQMFYILLFVKWSSGFSVTLPRLHVTSDVETKIKCWKWMMVNFKLLGKRIPMTFCTLVRHPGYHWVAWDLWELRSNVTNFPHMQRLV